MKNLKRNDLKKDIFEEEMIRIDYIIPNIEKKALPEIVELLSQARV